MLLGVSELRDQRVVRRAENGHEQIECYQQSEKQRVIHHYVSCLRQREKADGNERERYRYCAHERYAAAALISGAVRPSGYQRVCDSIEDTADSKYKSEQGQLEYDRMLCYARREYSCKRILLIRRTGIIIDHPVRDYSRKQAPSELSYGKYPEQLVCDWFLLHFISPNITKNEKSSLFNCPFPFPGTL